MKKRVLRMEHITKKFGSFKANEDITFDLHEGEVLTLLGENGAGKSTLMNVLYGLYRQDEGRVFVGEEEVSLRSSSDAVKHGIGMVHQHFMLIDTLTVFQNIILGMDKKYGHIIRENQLKEEIDELSKRYGLELDLDAKISEISVGAQQRVEIVKTLWRGSEILILDEPTAVLTDEEVEGLFRIIHKLTDEGKSVLFISHKLREVLQISDRIIVLSHGVNVGEFNPKTVNEQQLANTMVGEVVQQNEYPKSLSDKASYMSLKNVSFNAESKHNGIHNITLEIKPGEILGVAGVDGNGQSELIRMMTGLSAPESGELLIDGELVTEFSPHFFIGKGIAHIPEDRNKMGLVGDMSVQENLILKNPPVKGVTSHKGWSYHLKYVANNSEELRKKYDIRCQSIKQNAKYLSGGNQQKVILARELETEPKVLIAVHPTRGLDIGAATYVHSLIVEAKKRGSAIVLVSADIAEILQLSDRIIVMYEGGAVIGTDYENLDMDQLSLAIAGREKEEAGEVNE